MKIGIVTVALSHGGAERVGVLLANGFHQRGHDVCLFSDLSEPVVYKVNEGIRISDFVGKRANTLQKWLRAISRIRKQAKADKPDVIIGIMGLCSLVAYIACYGLNIPIVMTEHNSFERPESAPMSFLDRFFKWHINKLYPLITVLTKADKEVIGSRLKNVEVMPNPLLLKPVRDIPSKENVVLAAGRIDDWHYKGFDVLLKTWGRIMKNENAIRDKRWWLKIAGNGKKENFFLLMSLLPDGDWKETHGKWKSEKYRIEFLGFQKEIEQLFRQASVFVLSSRYEGFGLVLIEAMSQGCACVACDYKGRQKDIICSSSDFTQIVERAENAFTAYKSGICCEPDNVDALERAIIKVIKDDDYRESMRMNAVNRSCYFSVNNTIERWEELLISNLEKC